MANIHIANNNNNINKKINFNNKLSIITSNEGNKEYYDNLLAEYENMNKNNKRSVTQNKIKDERKEQINCSNNKLNKYLLQLSTKTYTNNTNNLNKNLNFKYENEDAFLYIMKNLNELNDTNAVNNNNNSNNNKLTFKRRINKKISLSAVDKNIKGLCIKSNQKKCRSNEINENNSFEKYLTNNNNYNFKINDENYNLYCNKNSKMIDNSSSFTRNKLTSPYKAKKNKLLILSPNNTKMNYKDYKSFNNEYNTSNLIKTKNNERINLINDKKKSLYNIKNNNNNTILKQTIDSIHNKHNSVAFNNINSPTKKELKRKSLKFKESSLNNKTFIHHQSDIKVENNIDKEKNLNNNKLPKKKKRVICCLPFFK